MNNFLKKYRSAPNRKDEFLKKSIITQLSTDVKEIQYFGVEENQSDKLVDGSEAVTNLCTTIEALFLHGLKDSFTHLFRRSLADVDEKPVPNFWPPLLVISHRLIIDQITNLSQITTEVGQCRAWIRLALNDCLLSSYLNSVKQDSSSLKSFYNSEAFLRDSELLDVAQRLIEGIEAKGFSLPCNSSLLNTWNPTSLNLAGIWTPVMKMLPVAPCDDVAQSLEDYSLDIGKPNTSDDSSTSAISFNSESSHSRHIPYISEDVVFKKILSKEEHFSTSDSDADISNSYEIREKSTMVVGNSLNQRTSWSSDENQIENIDQDEVLEGNKEILARQSMEDSFNLLITKYKTGHIGTPDLGELMGMLQENRFESEPIVNNNIKSENRSPVSRLLSRSESSIFTTHVGNISKEKGLDYHNFQCTGCQKEMGITHKPNICAFSGDYFCDTCMSSELITIPARIIHNWDFKLYPVSQKSFNFIDKIKDHPVIDFKVLNPYIYGVVQEMSDLQSLRIQLNFIRDYLYLCTEPTIKELQKLIFPREYMYEHIHQYSISDLADINNGILVQQLQKVVQFGRNHILSCWLCTQKAFFCELCKNDKRIFPFDVDNVSRCDDCHAVYHKGCLNSSKICPKCDRRRKREDLPIHDAIILE